MTNLLILAIIAGLLIIIALAIYAGKLLKQLKQQNQQQAQAELNHANGLKKHDKKVFDSVVIIVRAMKEEQCDFSEGCWRLSVLLNSLKMSSELEQQFPAIFELYERIKNLNILESRKQLSKRERMKEDLQRMKAEAELHPKIAEDLVQLHQYALERISSLNEEPT